jgi:uncharacterized protein
LTDSDRAASPSPAAPQVPPQRVPHFHLLAKPSGSTCNIDCTYCFFLSKEALYPDERMRMSPHTLETYLQQLLECHPGPEVLVAWQGGEPTLMGLDFFRQSIELVERFRRPGQKVLHTFQTNGIALDDDWCAFFKMHGVLVGLSVDGPREMHDAYRVTRAGQGTFDRVMKGLEHLRRHGVDYNILCTINAANQDHGRRVYRFLRDELGAAFIQFIPIVERATEETLPIANLGWSRGPKDKRLLYTQTGTRVTERSVGGAQYGRFLIDVFEEWVRHDIGRVYVQMFDVTLEAYFGRHSLCIHAPTCGNGPVLEHNGDVYACDHFVEPRFRIGNIHRTHLMELVLSPEQRRFGADKRDTLTAQCRACEVRSLCHGGCPKERFARSKDGEPGHNHLCEGLYAFFTHTRGAMQRMAALYAQGGAPASLMREVAAEDARRDPYAACPCDSGRKFRFCHGARGDSRSAAPLSSGT